MLVCVLYIEYSDKLPVKRHSLSVASTVFTQVGRGRARVRRFLAHCAASGLCVAGLYSILILMSECIGCFIEVLPYNTIFH